MAEKEELDDTSRIGISRSFDIPMDLMITEKEILRALAERIEKLLNGDPDRLFSLMYRLDINEFKIRGILQSGEDVPKGLAQLVYQRQLEKVESRQRFKSERPDDDLAW